MRHPQLGRRSVGVSVAVVAVCATFATGVSSTSASTEPPAASAVEIAMGFLDAYGAYDADRALSYLTDEAIDDPRPVEIGRTPEEFRLELAIFQAMRYRHTITGCEEVGESPSGVAVRCTFDMHAFGSDEVGLGPYTDNYWDLIVRDGRLTAAVSSWAVATNGFSAERWEPFAEWVVANYPDEVLALYTDDRQVQFVNSEETVLRLHQRVDEFVADEVARLESTRGWEVVWPGGDCQCADGSDYAFFVHHADPTKVVFVLDAGGACLSTYCVRGTPTEPPAPAGIFDFGHPENPFRDYTVVDVSYCTGDVHLGDNTAEAPSGRPVHFNGWVNGTAAREYVAANFPDAEQVVVIGLSAGAVAAPLYAAALSDQLPDARITVIADSSGAYPDTADSSAADPDAADPMLDDLWGMGTMRAAFPDYTGVWSTPRNFVVAGLHDPDIVLGRVDYAFDEGQAEWLVQLGVDAGDVMAAIDANEALIEQAGVTQHSYTAPGDDHIPLGGPEFYDLAVNGVPLVDWVTALIAGEPIDDVHCEDCETP
jgi:hypothetical protein